MFFCWIIKVLMYLSTMKQTNKMNYTKHVEKRIAEFRDDIEQYKYKLQIEEDKLYVTDVKDGSYHRYLHTRGMIETYKALIKEAEMDIDIYYTALDAKHDNPLSKVK